MSTYGSIDVVASVPQGAKDRWAAVPVALAVREDRLAPEEADSKWSVVNQLFGAQGEAQFDEVYAAVTQYFLVNGCSPEGRYKRVISTAGGLSCNVGEVVKVTGVLPGEIRQFLRAHMAKSYACLKYSPASHDEVLRNKAESLEIPRDQAWLLADWLKECECFTPDEMRLHGGLSTRLINAARAKRNVGEVPTRSGERRREVDDYQSTSGDHGY